jgi:hypothetical protein
MNKVFGPGLVTLSCLLVVACGTYYHKITYLPEANDPGWPGGVYACEAGKIKTTGIFHEPRKYESLVGVPIPFNYNNQLPLVWLAIDSKLLREKACIVGLVSLEDKTGRTIPAESVYSNLSSSDDGYDVFCFYYFPESVLAESTYTLTFNQADTHCPIPDLRVSRAEETGYRAEQLQ